uniref:NADH-ubiquinone oxidoreductase chain 3 n=1 Tax=Janus megamaculatus TaxID=2876199 RepID=A0A8K1TMY8_9HYME|nr:NADH dehydrogenase subunit 3 [Janus megamaculatus]UGN61608.1 NADH dehydrogenase subunit 3 [Janus megamaculatus]
MLLFSHLITMSSLLTIIMLTVNMLISKKKSTDREKASPFECGFDPLSPPRTPFSLRFYLVSLIFLIFDIEIVILFPLIPALWHSNPINWVITTLLFSMMLIWGLWIEWTEGSLVWVS